MNCIILNCNNQASNNLSVRLRREDTSAIWAPNTEAYLCDEHASQGFNVEITLTPREDNNILTQVQHEGGEPRTRTTPIRNQV